ncbi:MAG TPA: hypothetical protein DCG39_04875 [Opitutae bacterium]|nr:hypothetical protein [Opitutae bacterium]
MKRAVFLDRDGTLIRDAHYLKNPDDIEVIAGVGEALLRIREAGYGVFLHTNQSGIGRGYFDWEDVRFCNLRMLELYGLPMDFFDDVCIAPELPGDTTGYRKPSSRFETETMGKLELSPAECWMVGDKWVDAETGLSAGMRAALVETGKPIDDDVRSRADASEVSIHPDLPCFASQSLNLRE